MKLTTLLILFVFANSCQLFAANYYVDNSLTNSANTGTSWANAWTNFSSVQWQHNFQSAPRVSDGDTLYISGGTTNQVYDSPKYDPLYIFGSTTLTNDPVIVTPGVDAGHNGLVIFDGNSDTETATNVNWNGNAVGGQGSFIFNGGANTNFFFRNWYNTNNYEYASAMGNLEPFWSTFCNFSISNCGDGITINPAVMSSISNFSIVHIKGDHCIQVVGGQEGFDGFIIHHGLIRGNTTEFAGSGPDGIQLQSDGQTIHDVTFWSDPNGDVIIDQHPDDVQGGNNFEKVYNCTFHNFTGSGWSYDPSGPTIHDIVVANNIYVYDHTNYSVCTIAGFGSDQLVTDYSNIYYLNNTFVDYGSTALGSGTGSGLGFEWDKLDISQPFVTNFCFENNIFYRVGNGTNSCLSAFGSYLSTNFTYTSIILVSNLTYQDSNGGSTYFTTANQSTNQFQWQQNPLMTNQPVFVNYVQYWTNSDFHLASGDTAAIKKGTNLAALYTELGLPVADKDGNARPTTGAWDIGAYESVFVPPINTGVYLPFFTYDN